MLGVVKEAICAKFYPGNHKFLCRCVAIADIERSSSFRMTFSQSRFVSDSD